jgi:putative cell wall-binding protein
MPRTLPRLGALATAAVVGGAILFAPTAAHAADSDTIDDAYTLSAGVAVTVPAAHGLLANDLGVDVGLGLLISLETPPVHGALSNIGADGSFTYTPAEGWAGVDTFDYCLKLPKPLALCAGSTATVTVTTESVIERIAGADRYATSATVSAQKFASGIDTVFVASGEVFPDALSASAAAGHRNAPVLLVGRSAVSTEVDAELKRLKPKHIVLLGGTATIDASVATALGGYGAMDVTRIDGGDRYAVSASVSKQVFPVARPVVYVASGEVFPDALSGSAAAGRLDGPVLLVKKDAVPADVATELGRLTPLSVVILGGKNTISAAAQAEIDKAAKVASTRIGGTDRYDTSSIVSQKAFSPITDPTVYVASGETFPDALSGSAAAIRAHGPVLLVTRDGVPTTTAAELDRLKPTRIVVLGGESTITPAAYAALATHLK